MIHQYPERWTEARFNTLPDEDNRYEWKLGQVISERDENLFRQKLSKELGAFANSSGGTLFIGITDDRQLVGVRRLWKGRQTTKEWLENVIPSLLELRLQSFRVTTVEVTEETLQILGDDKVILAIDVDDSPLAPHQSSKDKVYYYRVSGNSERAPHHYLAYLWSRSSSNQAVVVRSWCTGFINKAITRLNFIAEQLASGLITDEGVSGMDTWSSNLQTLTADQVLRTFPELEYRCSDVTSRIQELPGRFNELKKLINDPSKLNNLLGIAVGAVASTHSLSPERWREIQWKRWMEHVNKIRAAEGLVVMSTEVFWQRTLDRLTLLLINPQHVTLDDYLSPSTDKRLIKPILEGLNEDPDIKAYALGLESYINTLTRDVLEFSQYLSDFRYQLCLRHSTTYAD